jgi:Spy/CpxP family protein refolding chaperone
MMYGNGSGMMYGGGPGMMYGGGPGMMYGDGDSFDCPYGGWGGGYPSGGPMQGWGRGPGASFNLTDEQRKKLQTLNETVWKQRQEMAQKMLEQRAQLHQLQLNDDPDPEAVIKAQRAMSDLRLKQMEAELRARREFQHSLSAEQRQQLRQMPPWDGRPW